MDAMQEVSG